MGPFSPWGSAFRVEVYIVKNGWILDSPLVVVHGCFQGFGFHARSTLEKSLADSDGRGLADDGSGTDACRVTNRREVSETSLSVVL